MSEKDTDTRVFVNARILENPDYAEPRWEVHAEVHLDRCWCLVRVANGRVFMHRPEGDLAGLDPHVARQIAAALVRAAQVAEERADG